MVWGRKKATVKDLELTAEIPYHKNAHDNPTKFMEKGHMTRLTEGVKPSYGFCPALESAKSFLAFWMYDASPPG
jgi:hypothetical protein